MKIIKEELLNLKKLIESNFILLQFSFFSDNPWKSLIMSYILEIYGIIAKHTENDQWAIKITGINDSNDIQFETLLDSLITFSLAIKSCLNNLEKISSSSLYELTDNLAFQFFKLKQTLQDNPDDINHTRYQAGILAVGDLTHNCSGHLMYICYAENNQGLRNIFLDDDNLEIHRKKMRTIFEDLKKVLQANKYSMMMPRDLNASTPAATGTPTEIASEHSSSSTKRFVAANSSGLFEMSSTEKRLKKIMSTYHLTDHEPSQREKALRMAAANNISEDLIFLLDEIKVNIDAADTNPSSRRTALHHAAARGHCEIVHLLLQRNANLKLKDANDRTAQMLATPTGLSFKLIADASSVLSKNNSETSKNFAKK